MESSNSSSNSSSSSSEEEDDRKQSVEEIVAAPASSSSLSAETKTQTKLAQLDTAIRNALVNYQNSDQSATARDLYERTRNSLYSQRKYYKKKATMYRLQSQKATLMTEQGKLRQELEKLTALLAWARERVSWHEQVQVQSSGGGDLLSSSRLGGSNRGGLGGSLVGRLGGDLLGGGSGLISSLGGGGTLGSLGTLGTSSLLGEGLGGSSSLLTGLGGLGGSFLGGATGFGGINLDRLERMAALSSGSLGGAGLLGSNTLTAGRAAGLGSLVGLPLERSSLEGLGLEVLGGGVLSSDLGGLAGSSLGLGTSDLLAAAARERELLLLRRRQQQIQQRRLLLVETLRNPSSYASNLPPSPQQLSTRQRLDIAIQDRMRRLDTLSNTMPVTSSMSLVGSSDRQQQQDDETKKSTP